MSEEELWELISIVSEGQDSEQRRKVEQYITDLQKEIERLNKLLDETRLSELNKEYRINKAIEYIEHENFKRTILVGVSTKKYTKDILNKILEILDKGE